MSELFENVPLSELANALRALSVDTVEKAKSGHPGLPMGAADIVTVLFTRFLKYDTADTKWPDRDRFILSAGHGSAMLYSLLHLTGVEGVTIDELKRFRQLGSLTPGHPENWVTPGVEITTGPLGQGIATSVGFALAERMLNSEYGDELIKHYTYVLASEGDFMEGVSQEAIALAGHLKLERLIVLYDDNGVSIDGPLSLSDSVDQTERLKSAGWNAVRVDGHNYAEIAGAIEKAQNTDRPTFIACKTTIGYGAPNKAGKSKAHGEPLGPEELAGAKKAWNWTYGPFEVPDHIRAAWLKAGRRGKTERDAWQQRLELIAPDKRAEFLRRMNREVSPALKPAVAELKESAVAEPKAMATRKASGAVIGTVMKAVPELVLGSADLTPSNNTRTADVKDIAPRDYNGRYIHWGIREHGMAAALNGMTLHGGYRVASGAFLVFADYARPAIRLAALSKLPVIYVFTHDSIGVGEDGPTHQPVETIAGMRAVPNLRVFRPADIVETAECWQLALESEGTPTVLALSRQDVPQLRLKNSAENLSATGGYELIAADGEARVSLFASGTEVSLAVDACKKLVERGIATRVVSVPSLELLIDQPEDVKARIVGKAPIKVGIEAGVRFGWDAVIGSDGIFVGMKGFGASAPAKDLYPYFGITADAVVEKVLKAAG
ncbi:MAG: transketolase [Methylobacteriaceae bacterium]|nr:transketolase [Methylobacteriaceae bacterium]